MLQVKLKSSVRNFDGGKKLAGKGFPEHIRACRVLPGLFATFFHGLLAGSLFGCH
jgi:hypothetical protein